MQGIVPECFEDFARSASSLENQIPTIAEPPGKYEEETEGFLESEQAAKKKQANLGKHHLEPLSQALTERYFCRGWLVWLCVPAA